MKTLIVLALVAIVAALAGGGLFMLRKRPSDTTGRDSRMAWALGGETLADVAARVEEPLRLGPPDGLWEKIRLLGKLKEWGSAAPKSVGRGACQEVVVQGDELAKRGLLDLMPVLTTWPRDGGPYITTPLVITRSPENGRRNIGMYRMHAVHRFDQRCSHFRICR